MLFVMSHVVKTHYNKASVFLNSFSPLKDNTNTYIFNVIPKRFSILIQQAADIYFIALKKTFIRFQSCEVNFS